VHVRVPDVVDKSRTYSFCAINTANRSYTRPRGSRTSPPTLGAGLNDQCGDKPGIAWDWRVLLPKLEKSVGRGTGAGRIAMAQLFAKTVEADDKVCVKVGNVNDPSGWPADDASFYGPIRRLEGRRRRRAVGPAGELRQPDDPAAHPRARPTGSPFELATT
jgi:hypothetical protein